MTTPVLSVENLGISSPHTSLVRNVSFTIRPGERVGLIGESGSGKSLTAMSIFGLLHEGLTATGSVTLAGVEQNIFAADEKTIAGLRGQKMAMVFQEPMTALNPTMRIGAQVAEAMTVHGASRSEANRRALELLETVDLPEPRRISRSYPHQLSGGQRQRVALAIAIANSPSLLICDEPTTALDVTVQARMLALIEEAVEATDSALLFITHDLAVVATICEYIVVMYGGELLETGKSTEIFENPRHPYTRALLAASALTPDEVTGKLPTIPDDLFSYRDFKASCPRCAGARHDTDEGTWIETETGGYACWHEEVLV